MLYFKGKICKSHVEQCDGKLITGPGVELGYEKRNGACHEYASMVQGEQLVRVQQYAGH